MLAEVLAALAAAGGTAVVGAMATDAWESARSGVARLLGRGADPHRQEIIKAQLDEDAALLERVGDAEREMVRQELEPVWRRRLATYLDQHPEAVEELRELVEQISDRLPGEQRMVVNNQLTVVRDHGTGNIVQGGNQHIHHYHGPTGSPGGQPEPGASG
ncbi:MAG: hypothetical protein ACRDSZ_10955 [Pseudonocardiaceae bacterium]